jgi:MFS family permease
LSSATSPPPCSSCGPPSCWLPAAARTGPPGSPLGLYVAYNLAATLASIPAGRLGDRRGAVLVLVLGVGLFGLAYAGFAAGLTSVLALAPWFVAAGVAIGCVETAEHAAVAALAPVELRGSAFGLLAAVQSVGNLAASAIAGLLWTLASPRVAFAYLVAWMVLALGGLLLAHVGLDKLPAPRAIGRT